MNFNFSIGLSGWIVLACSLFSFGDAQTLLTGQFGSFSSPNYPEVYDNNVNKIWRIKVRPYHGIKIEFITFDLQDSYEEGGGSCINDYVTISEGTEEIARHCGNRLRGGVHAPRRGEVFLTNGNTATVQFVSDYSNNGIRPKGFKIHYSEIEIRCLKLLTNPLHGRKSDMPAKGYYNFRDVVKFTCDVGYELKPGVSSRVICLSNGQWSHPQPVCHIKVCREPTHLMNIANSYIVDIETKQFVYGENVTIKCDPWYKRVWGPAVYECSDNKIWESRDDDFPFGLPRCRPRCGWKDYHGYVEALIAGGTRVKNSTAWPWMAFIDLGGGRRGTDYCGGTLVDEFTVVTTASCLSSLDVGDSVTVWLGILDRYEDNFNYTQSFVVPYENITPHKLFRNTGTRNLYAYFDYDVAVLKFARPAELSNNVHPICLPGVHQDMIIADAILLERRPVILGWGKNEHGNFSRHLMKARIRFVSHDECRIVYEHELGVGAGATITDRVICAGLTRNDGSNRDSCSGDSGGPLMSQYDSNDKWYLNGIVSFGFTGNGCGKRPSYGGYTNVGEIEVAEFIDGHLM